MVPVDQLFREFTSGRRSFDSLCEELRERVAGTEAGHAAVEQMLTELVNVGRLPADLAQILRSSLRAGLAAGRPNSPPASAAVSGSAAPLPPSTESGDMPLPEASGGSPVALPPNPLEADPASTTKRELHDRVDDLVLDNLANEFRSYRKSAKTAASQQESGQARLLDSALESFRSMRLRRDASKAEEGVRRTRGPAAEETRRVGIGTILKDRFVLDREIGRGGMGVVYRAVDRRRLEAGHDKPYVAVKLLSGEIRRTPEILRGLEAEARRAQDLAHPNIVTVFDFDRDGATIFVVMELLLGRPLDAVLREAEPRGLGYEESRLLVDEICQGLAHAHRQGVIHCDLKPANVFLIEGGTAKILDFGLAIASRGGVFEPALLDGYTLTYASPDILKGAPRHPADDVYALACLVYVMVAGRRPFGKVSALEAAGQRLTAARPAGMPGPAWRALLRGLSFERDRRWPDAEAFRSAYFGRGWGGWFGR